MWNSQALDQRYVAPPGLQEPRIEYSLFWGLGPSLVRQEPGLCDTLAVVGKKGDVDDIDGVKPDIEYDGIESTGVCKMPLLNPQKTGRTTIRQFYELAELIR